MGTSRNYDRETIGGQVGEVAKRLGRPLMPWQQYAADVAGEIDPDTGRLAYDEVDVTIMRQVGKTLWTFALMVHRCTMVPHQLGRQRVTFTMQKRDNARRKLERDFAPMLRETDQFLEITNPKARPSRSTKQWKLSLNNGSEHMLFGQGNYLQIDTPSKQAGHGDTLDLGVIDEARFLPDDRVEQAMRPAQATRDNAQLVVASTAGDEESFYLWRKVLAGRRAAELGEHSRVAYLEWSLPDDADLDDPDVWFEFHPALGHTIELDFIMAELARARRNPDEGGEDTFRQEYANQWVRIPVLGDGPRERVIDPERWSKQNVGEHAKIVGDVAMAVDVSPEGRSGAIAIAGRGADGVPIVDVLSYDAGTFWLEARIANHRDTWEPKLIGYGPGSARAVAPEIGRAAGTVPVKDLPAHEYAAGCEAFVLAVQEKRVRHLDQAWLNSAVDGAAKKVRGTGWLWDRQTALADVTALVACTVALRLLETLPEPEPHRAPRIWSFANTRE
ncbi:MAG TPA: terminase family protein [Ilumatobacteraceae bacterium]